MQSVLYRGSASRASVHQRASCSQSAVVRVSLSASWPPRRHGLVRQAAGVSRSTTGSSGESSGAAVSDVQGAGGCPVLSALRELPQASVPWSLQLDFFGDPFAVQSAVLRDSPVARGPFFFQDSVFVGGEDALADVLKRRADVYESQPPENLSKLFGRSLVNAKGAEHARTRALLAPAFTSEAVAAFLPRIQQLASRYWSRWATSGSVKEWHAQIKLFTFEVICVIVAGLECDDNKLAHLSALFTTFGSGLAFPLTWDLPFTPFGRAMAARKELIHEVRTALQNTRNDLQRGEAPTSMMAAWLTASDEEGSGMSDEELENNFLGMLLAGHDTTSSTLNNAVWFLHEHPHVLQRLREEHMRLREKHGGQLSSQYFREMEYTEAFLKEVWRTRPTVPVGGRVATQDTELVGYRVPAGKPIIIAFNYTTKTDKRWTQSTGDLSPEVFNPDRFLGEARSVQGAQLPFGAGSHSCLGATLATMESKIFLATLCCGYDYTILPGSELVKFVFPYTKMDAEVRALQ